jgi:hypothetical protein
MIPSEGLIQPCPPEYLPKTIKQYMLIGLTFNKIHFINRIPVFKEDILTIINTDRDIPPTEYTCIIPNTSMLFYVLACMSERDKVFYKDGHLTMESFMSVLYSFRHIKCVHGNSNNLVDNVYDLLHKNQRNRWSYVYKNEFMYVIRNASGRYDNWHLHCEHETNPHRVLYNMYKHASNYHYHIWQIPLFSLNPKQRITTFTRKTSIDKVQNIRISKLRPPH